MHPILHVLPHTHWDREWFVPSGFTREWLIPFFDALFEHFDSDPAYRFTLDGQSILIEDYVSLLGRSQGEAALTRIEGLVREGRLTVGPYYQQPDWQLVSGEALIRNLLIGIDDTRVLGAHRPVGWLMDNFGQIAQCPQIHAGFDITGVFAWRGFDLLPEDIGSEIWWEGPDGSRLQVVYLLDSYRNGMRLFSRPDILARRIADAQERIRSFSGDENLLLMNGYDQEMEPERPDYTAADRRIRVVVPQEYIAAKERAFHAPETPTVRGRQYSGRFISVFPGILSARNYLKVANDLAQAFQERYAEPLVALLSTRSDTTDTVKEVEELRDELHLIWRLILQNHPHDTICGVSSDPIHEEAELRLAEIEMRQMRALHRVLARWGLRPAETGSETALFNPSPYPRRGMVGGRWSVTVPPLCIAELPSDRDEQEGIVPVIPTSHDGATELSNGLVSVWVHDDGTIIIRPLGRGTDDTPRTYITWRDTGDAGDTYNFSSPSKDTPQTVSFTDGRLTIGSQTADRIVSTLSGILRLPKELTPERDDRSSQWVENPVTLHVELRSDESFIRTTVVMDNVSRDHRLQMVVTHRTLPEDAPEKNIGLRVLNQFAWDDPDDQRAALTPFNEADLPVAIQRLMLGAREPEMPRFIPCDRAFAIGSEAGAALVAHRGLHELERIETGSVAATVVRAVGWLARGDLSSRTGDAGPEIFTPDAQCRRRITVHVCVAPLASLGESESAAVARTIEEALHPMVPLAPLDGTHNSDDLAPVTPYRLIPQEWNETAGSSMLSALKIREDGAGLVLRISNPGTDAATMRWNAPVEPLSMAERPDGPHTEASTSHTIAPRGIFTVTLPSPTATELRSHRDVSPRDRFASAMDGRIPYRRFDVTPFRLRATAWSLLTNEPTALGTIGEEPAEDDGYLPSTLREEERRLQRLTSAREAASTALRQAREGGADELDRTVVTAASRVSTLMRQALEAQLSVLLTRRLCDGGDRAALYTAIRDIALKLNHARVAKRADDYLVALPQR